MKRQITATNESGFAPLQTRPLQIRPVPIEFASFVTSSPPPPIYMWSLLLFIWWLLNEPFGPVRVQRLTPRLDLQELYVAWTIQACAGP